MLEASAILAFVVGLFLVWLLWKILSFPMKLLWKFVTNSIVGALMLCAVKLIGVEVHINILTALVAGVFGVPGVIAIIFLEH